MTLWVLLCTTRQMFLKGKAHYPIHITSSKRKMHSQLCMQHAEFQHHSEKKTERDSMTILRVIRNVEVPTVYVNTMARANKKSRELRVCMDLKDLNENIKREYYPKHEDITVKWQMPCSSQSLIRLKAFDNWNWIRTVQNIVHSTHVWQPVCKVICHAWTPAQRECICIDTYSRARMADSQNHTDNSTCAHFLWPKKTAYRCIHMHPGQHWQSNWKRVSWTGVESWKIP